MQCWTQNNIYSINLNSKDDGEEKVKEQKKKQRSQKKPNEKYLERKSTKEQRKKKREKKMSDVLNENPNLDSVQQYFYRKNYLFPY